MIPKQFDYYSPETLDEAVRILGTHEDTKVLAGGQSLLPLLKLRVAAPAGLVDISKLSGLSYVRDEAEYLAIGALTTHDNIERDGTIRERFTLLNDAVSHIGDQQVRNRGTIGGSACHADPAADLPTALMVADAKFVIHGKDGRRVVGVRDFFIDFFITAVAHDEILAEVRLPYMPPRSATSFVKHSLREGDFAIAIVGSAITLDEGEVCRDARIGFGAAGPTPVRAIAAERRLIGNVLSDESISQAAERVVEGASPPSDVHGSAEYRLAMIKALTRRSLKLAISRVPAGGGRKRKTR